MNENRVEKWIKTVLQNNINKEVVFVKSNDSFTDLKIQRGLNIKFIEFKSLSIKLDTAKNTIIKIDDSYEFCEFMKNNLLNGAIVITEGNSVKNLLNAIEKRDINMVSKIEYKSLEPITFEDILNYDEKRLREFILYRELILKKVNKYYKELNLQDIDYFLEVYFNKKILIAKFIQKLYRLATLNFILSDKKVGGIIKETIGVSSKVVTPKYIRLLGSTEKLKNTRIYDLKINQLEVDVKMNIAKKLVKLDIKKLDVINVSKITELPIKAIENMYKGIFIS